MKYLAFLLILGMVGCGKTEPKKPQFYSLVIVMHEDTIARCTGGDPDPKPLPLTHSEYQGKLQLYFPTEIPPHVDHCELVGGHSVDDLMNFVLTYNRGPK